MSLEIKFGYLSKILLLIDYLKNEIIKCQTFKILLKIFFFLEITHFLINEKFLIFLTQFYFKKRLQIF